jgi:hypothetical protein
MADNKPFEWNEDLVRQCYIHIRNAFDNPDENNGGNWEGITKEIERFKKSKELLQPKEKFMNPMEEKDVVCPRQSINAQPPSTDTPLPSKEWERQLLEAESKAFYAGRERDYNSQIHNPTMPYFADKYPTFSDYKNKQ